MPETTDRFPKQLKVILTLLDGNGHTAQELSEIMGTTRRNTYYFIRQLESCGFNVVHERRLYRIHPLSPVLDAIYPTVSFTNDEALYLYGLLNAVGRQNAMAGLLLRKFERFYDIGRFQKVKYSRKNYINTISLEKAIKHKQLVILHDYASSHSQTVSDRTVEPFCFLGDRADIRAYEISSKKNKTFKISRIGKVEVMDAPWFNEAEHHKVYTDLFLFSGEEQRHVVLRLDLLARNLMLDEYPHSEKMLRADGEGSWIFETDLVRYEGISRFMLGLAGHVEIIESDDLRRFMDKEIKRLVDHRRQLLGGEIPTDRDDNALMGDGKIQKGLNI